MDPPSASRSEPSRPRILLGGDVGEGLPLDLERRFVARLDLVSIACGGHAGDRESMGVSVETARSAGCLIGAHPSYPDRAGFGRRRLTMSPAAIEASVAEQVGALRAVAEAGGAALSHVKAHGALYHACDEDVEIAAAVLRAVRGVAPGCVLVGFGGGAAVRTWRAAGAEVWEESFADRGYSADGRLLPRDVAGSVIEDPAAATEQALRLAASWSGSGARGTRVLCLHGDTPNAPAIAEAVRAALGSR